jgi:hypothetical protein
MKNIRIGNDIEVIWMLYSDKDGVKVPYSISGSTLSLYLSGENFRRRKIEDFSRTDNSISWKYYGKDQTDLGVHAFELVINEGSEGMVTIDRCDAFALIRHYGKPNDSYSEGVGFTRIQFVTTINNSGNSTVEPEPGDTPGGGGSNIDPELLEGFIPLSRDFSDDFNNDFTR